MSITKEQQFGIIGTFIFLGCFTGLLLLFGFSTPFPPPEEEGILINFGTDNNGMGDVEPMPAEELQQESVPEQTTPPPPVKTTEKTEEVITQNFEKTAALEEKKRKEKEATEEIKRKQELAEQERIKQEEIDRQKRIEEERLKQEQQQKAINDRAKNAFGGKNPNGDNTGEGNNGGTGNQGDPNGDINSKNRIGGQGGDSGISFDLKGRNARSLPVPDKIHKQEGIVVVEITVDQDGRVVNASAGKRGTTLGDEAVWKEAEKAALKATFDVKKDASVQQKGTITYYFGFE